MKKAISILLALCLLLALGACGEKEEPAKTDAPAAADLPAKTELPSKADTPAKADAPAQTAAPAKPDAPAPAAAESPAGYYKLLESTEDGVTESTEEMEAMGLIYYLVLESDGTGYMEILGEKDELTWDDKVFKSEDTEPSEYRYADGKITILGDDGASMVFVRLTAEEEANFLENGSGTIEDIFNGLTQDGERFDTYGELDGFALRFIGAEAAKDSDGKPAVRVWYEFTNLSDRVTDAFTEVYFTAVQDGNDLEFAYIYEDVPESGYCDLGVAPNYTMRCTELFSYDPDGGEIEIAAGGLYGDNVVYTIDPQALPGAPADDFVLGDPDFGTDYMDELWDSDENLTILDAEAVEDWDGEEAILVHMTFTNNTDEAQCFFLCYSVYALQDGAGLVSAYCDEYSEEQDNIYVDIEPGDSIDVAAVFVLRGDGPIAFAASGAYELEDSYLGCVYEQS